MTIEKHIEHLSDIMDSMPDDACGDWRDSLAYAIKVIHKYQKIKEIVKITQQLCSYGNAFIDIREVIEDGYNDL